MPIRIVKFSKVRKVINCSSPSSLLPALLVKIEFKLTKIPRKFRKIAKVFLMTSQFTVYSIVSKGQNFVIS